MSHNYIKILTSIVLFLTQKQKKKFHSIFKTTHTMFNIPPKESNQIFINGMCLKNKETAQMTCIKIVKNKNFLSFE